MSQNPTVSFEFFPPKSEAMAARLWDSVSRLDPLRPDFVSVTYGAGGSTRERTHDTVRRMVAESRLAPAAHLTCVSASQSDVLGVARQYWEDGVRHIVALRGDAPDGMGAPFQPHPDGFASSIDLIAALRANGPDDLDISVACYPEPHPDSRGDAADIAFLRAKQDAGATRAISQFFFDPEVFLRFTDRARAAGIHLPILPGIMLQPNFAGLKRIAGLCGASLPDWLHARYDGTEEDAPLRDRITADLAAELCQRLQAEGINHFHFYTLNRAELTLDTCGRLGLHPDQETTE